MFSYLAGVWQTYAAKRGEFRFNGAAWSLSGEMLAAFAPGSLGFAHAGRPRRLSLHGWIQIGLIDSFHWTRGPGSFTMNSLRNRLCSRFPRS